MSLQNVISIFILVVGVLALIPGVVDGLWRIQRPLYMLIYSVILTPEQLQAYYGFSKGLAKLLIPVILIPTGIYFAVT